MQDEDYLQLAIEQGRLPPRPGEVSAVGAVDVYKERSSAAAGTSSCAASTQPPPHEIVALRSAAQHLSSYRLTGCELYSTLKFLLDVCAGAMIHARISRLICTQPPGPKAGAARSSAPQ